VNDESKNLLFVSFLLNLCDISYQNNSVSSKMLLTIGYIKHILMS